MGKIGKEKKKGKGNLHCILDLNSGKWPNVLLRMQPEK